MLNKGKDYFLSCLWAIHYFSCLNVKPGKGQLIEYFKHFAF